MDPALTRDFDADPEIGFDLPEGVVEFQGADPVDGLGGEIAEDPATAAAREAQQELRLAQELRRPIDRAVTFATVSAWTLAVFTLFSLPGMFSGFTGFFIAAGLGACSFFEFRGRNALREMKPGGACALARNQLLLGGVILVYALSNIAQTAGGTGRYDQAIAQVPELESVLGQSGGLGGLMTTLTVGYYGLVAVGAAVGQGLMFGFHRRRRAMVEAFTSDTAAWIREPAA